MSVLTTQLHYVSALSNGSQVLGSLLDIARQKHIGWKLWQSVTCLKEDALEVGAAVLVVLMRFVVGNDEGFKLSVLEIASDVQSGEVVSEVVVVFFNYFDLFIDLLAFLLP